MTKERGREGIVRKAFFGVLLLGFLIGCSPGKDVPIAEKAIDQFHERLNAGDLDAVYETSGNQMKTAATKDFLSQFLAAVHRKLGNFQSGKTAGWNDQVMTGGHTLTINYSAEYERGSASESFTFSIENDRATLEGYHINSNALIVN
jgi:hypothetical protein